MHVSHSHTDTTVLSMKYKLRVEINLTLKRSTSDKNRIRPYHASKDGATWVWTVQRRDTFGYRNCDGAPVYRRLLRVALKAGARHTRRCWTHPLRRVCGRNTNERLFENVIFFLHVLERVLVRKSRFSVKSVVRCWSTSHLQSNVS